MVRGSGERRASAASCEPRAELAADVGRPLTVDDWLNKGAVDRTQEMRKSSAPSAATIRPAAVAANDPFSFDFDEFSDEATDAAHSGDQVALGGLSATDRPLGVRGGVESPASVPETNAANEALARIEAKMCEIATTLMAAFDEPEPPHVPRARITQAAILQDVAAMERAARRLRRFIQGLAKCTVEVVPPPAATPPVIDEVMQARARRALARSGFVRVDR